MIAKKVRVSEKGQIALPVDVRREAGIKQGDDLFLIQKGNKILLEKSERVAERIAGDFSDLLKHSEDIARKLWDNKEDEIWDTV